MNESTFTILLGGPVRVTPRLEAAIAGSRVIAADGGMRHALPLGLKPELWVGDFDSSEDLSQDDFADVPRQAHPPRKNLTDGEIAIEEALSRGATRLVLVGALGGERSDQALMHLILSVTLANQGLDVHLTSGEEEAWPLLSAQPMTLDLPPASLFSVLGFSELKGLSIAGARYPLQNFELPFGSSRTISNVAEGAVTLSLASGDAVILARPYDLTGA
ncbi:thiamine diphosphokinase [Rhizobium paknamense]|uniref:Thiamine diphosphokinase n=1 Tax=Rhizobium paknamense TaxID=1206817 RepID=A0ABU0IGJ4_9HYPH|nr:thiamine diphosphokinase [Rhizobium paknamense]MDQ0457393.1 thiamine pyrophosphokinase [Rhizobium paknamense]